MFKVLQNGLQRGCYIRQYTFADILNGLNDQGSSALAPDTGASNDPSTTILLNNFAGATETPATSDGSTGSPSTFTGTPVVASAVVNTYDSALWNEFAWS